MAAETYFWFPKYTCLTGIAGGQTYRSDKWDVAKWKTVYAHVMVEAAFSTTTITAGFEESADGEAWTALATTGVTAGTLATVTKADPKRFMRLAITVTGADKAITMWATSLVRDT